MNAGPPQFVSRTQASALREELQQMPGEEQFGFFGPLSMMWSVHREAGVFLGAGRAALLQLAHPWVAAAIDQHSNLKNDAIGRFHSTFRVIYTMVFGTRRQALAASQQLYNRHTTIRGTLPETNGSYPAHDPYAANETAALLWVFATLADTAVLAYEAVLPPLSLPEKEAYYAEFRRMGVLFGIAPEVMPPSWPAFAAYMQGMLRSPVLAVDARGRALGQSVLSGVGTWVHPPQWYRAVTAEWLPLHLREGFDLRFQAAEQKAAAHAHKWLPRLYPRLPAVLRYVGPFYEAKALLQGRAPGLWTRWNNRFWMGRPEMLFPDR